MPRPNHAALRRFFSGALSMHPRSLADLYHRVRSGLDTATPVDEDSQVPDPQAERGVLVLPIRGTIVHHMTDAYGSFGLVTPTEMLVEALDRAEADDAVTGVLLDADSGGGMAAGTPEAAERIYQFRQSGKPIYGLANSFAASACYYLLAPCSKVYVTPSGEVGSIGTLMIHEDMTGMLEQIGVKVEILRASEAENKARLNPFEPLSKEERAHAIAQLDTINARFLADVGRFRGMEADQVAAVSENGRTFLAEAAVAAGLVDGIKTLAEVLAEMEAGAGPDEARREALREMFERGAMSPEEARRQVDEDQAEPTPAARALPEGAEVRSLDGTEVRAAGERAETLTGTALRYGSRSLDLGGFREEFAPGAFDASLESDDLRVLWQHDGRYVFGRVRSGTARIWSDDAGLHYEATPPNAQWARDAMESIRRGDVTCNSFAFRVEKGGERWERQGGELVRTVTKARLYEVGPQTDPAYTDTTVAVRGMEAHLAAERARGALELRRRRLAMLDVPYA